MNIIKAIAHEQVFKSFLGDLSTWTAWGTALRCLYGLPLKKQTAKDLVLKCTGRSAEELPAQGFQTAVFLCGRRAGKSRIAALIGAYESLFCGHEKKLAPGEVGIIPIISPTKEQSGIVWKALQSVFSIPMLQAECVDTKESDKLLVLRNGLRIKVLVSDWRSVRGFTIVCAIIDELCFLSLSEEMKIRNDLELIRALQPGLATTGGKLIGISSKYSRKGWAYSQWLKQHGSNKGKSPSFREAWQTLVWDAASRTMNPTLRQAVIDAAMAEDPAAARSEYGNGDTLEWREDISQFIERSVVEALVIKGRVELLPNAGVSYFGFVDISGGRSDSAALAISHAEGRKVILDFLKEYKPPFNPYSVIGQMAHELKRFSLGRVTGDNYSAEFCSSAFKENGIAFQKADRPKSRLYSELLPRLCSSEIELLDVPRLVDQLSALERRTRSGGQDSIDSPPAQHDDLANVVAGVGARGKVVRIGSLFKAEERTLVGLV